MRGSYTKSRLARSVASVLEMLEQRMLFNASATLASVDTATSGNWSGKYGADGYSVIGGTTQLPTYATLSIAGDQFYEWEAPGTTDTRALPISDGSSTRVAATDYSSSSFTINVDISDNQTHQVALYVLDEDYRNRSETVTATDPSTSTQLSTYDVKNFTGGEYLIYNVSGDVTFTFTNDPGSLNAVVSGVFFDPGSGGTTSGGGSGSSVSASATYVDTDSTTQGSWTGVYGNDGYSVLGGSTSLPAYATFSTVGSTFYEWEAPSFTNDNRALTVTRAGNTQRVAACDFSDSGSFAVDLDVNGSAQVALYILDDDYYYQKSDRAETIQISSAATGAVLTSQNITNFTQGKYLVYDISGDVQITVINDPGSVNCVLSGIFFDDGKPASGGGTGGTGGGTSGPTTLTVGPGEEYATIQAAVNAATSGDTIDVYSGTYNEQVVLPEGDSNLTLEAAKGQTVYVEPPTGGMTSTGAIIEDDGGDGDTIQGLNVMGPGTTTGELQFGILIDGGATGVNVLDNNISYIGDDNFAGFGLSNPQSTGTPSDTTGRGIALTDGSATIANNIISEYQKAGILIGLAPGVTGSPTWIQSAVVENNVITGVGAQEEVTQYGIEFVGLRATGSAENNRTSENSSPSVIGNADGILVYNAGQVSVLSNIVYSNDTNITIDGGQDSNGNPLGGSDYAIVTGNQTFDAIYFDGIDILDGVSKVTVNWNYSYDNAVDGIFIDQNSGGNTIENNLVINNANYDIEDATYSPSNYQGSPVYGTNNFYYQDQFGNEGSNDPSLPSTSYT